MVFKIISKILLVGIFELLFRSKSTLTVPSFSGVAETKSAAARPVASAERYVAFRSVFACLD